MTAERTYGIVRTSRPERAQSHIAIRQHLGHRPGGRLHLQSGPTFISRTFREFVTRHLTDGLTSDIRQGIQVAVFNGADGYFPSRLMTAACAKELKMTNTPINFGTAHAFADARLQTLICTSQKEEAAHFYGEVQGLPLMRESQGALIYRVGFGELRVSTVPSTQPSAHTMVGFEVHDARSAARELATAGVSLERFEDLGQDKDSVVRLPDATEVVWFRDPDGNLLSAVTYGKA